MSIQIANSENEIAELFDVMVKLRPHLVRSDFTRLIKHLMDTQNYWLAGYWENGRVLGAAGCRIGEWLHTGKYLEIEELVVAEEARSKGIGKRLLSWAEERAREEGCNQVRLVSGVTRADAHRFYERENMAFEARYYSKTISG